MKAQEDNWYLMVLTQTITRTFGNEMPVADLQDTTIEHRETRIGGAIVPYTIERPLQPIDEIPLLFAAGFYGIEPGYRDIRHATAQLGKISVTYQRGIRQGLDFFNPKHFFKPYRLTQQSPYAVMRDMRDNDFDQFDVVGHSMGGTAATEIAQRRPDHFRSIVLLGSAGLNGHGLPSLAVRTPIFLAKEVVPAIPDLVGGSVSGDARHAAEYALSNPARVISEAVHVAQHDIRGHFDVLRAAGVKTAVLAFETDEFFPLASVREHVSKSPDLFRVVPGGHIAPQREPELVAQHILNALATINNPVAA